MQFPRKILKTFTLNLMYQYIACYALFINIGNKILRKRK